MNDQEIKVPAFYLQIQEQSTKMQFGMPSDLQTGSLLRTLAASRPAGCFLEIGTGTGLSLAWIVEGMDDASSVISIDNHAGYQSVAAGFFNEDSRVSLITTDGVLWLKENEGAKFDLIFADAWPGKYELFDEAIEMVKPGGFFLIDDMLLQPNWPEGHHLNVEALIRDLEQRADIVLTKLNWSTGLILIVKK